MITRTSPWAGASASRHLSQQRMPPALSAQLCSAGRRTTPVFMSARPSMEQRALEQPQGTTLQATAPLPSSSRSVAVSTPIPGWFEDPSLTFRNFFTAVFIRPPQWIFWLVQLVHWFYTAQPVSQPDVVYEQLQYQQQWLATQLDDLGSSLREQVARMEADLQDIRRRGVPSLEEARLVQENRQLVRDCTQLQTRVRQLETQNRSLTVQSEKVHSEVLLLRRTVAMKTGELTEATGRVSQLEQECDTLVQDRDMLEESLSQANREQERLHGRLQELQMEAEAAAPRQSSDSHTSMRVVSAPRAFEIGFGIQDQTTLLNSLALHAEQLANSKVGKKGIPVSAQPQLLANMRVGQQPDLQLYLKQGIDQSVRQCVVQHVLTQTAMNLAGQAVRQYVSAKVDAALRAALPVYQVAQQTDLAVQLGSAVARTGYLALGKATPAWGAWPRDQSDMHHLVRDTKSQLSRWMGVTGSDVYTLDWPLNRLAATAVQVTLLCRSLQPQAPGCSVMCGGHVNQDWSEGTMEPPVKEIPMEGLSRPEVLCVLRPSLQFTDTQHGLQGVLVKAQVVAFTPVPVEAPLHAPDNNRPPTTAADAELQQVAPLLASPGHTPVAAGHPAIAGHAVGVERAAQLPANPTDGSTSDLKAAKNRDADAVVALVPAVSLPAINTKPESDHKQQDMPVDSGPQEAAQSQPSSPSSATQAAAEIEHYSQLSHGQGSTTGTQ